MIGYKLRRSRGQHGRKGWSVIASIIWLATLFIVASFAVPALIIIKSGARWKIVVDDSRYWSVIEPEVYSKDSVIFIRFKTIGGAEKEIGISSGTPFYMENVGIGKRVALGKDR